MSDNDPKRPHQPNGASGERFGGYPDGGSTGSTGAQGPLSDSWGSSSDDATRELHLGDMGKAQAAGPRGNAPAGPPPQSDSQGGNYGQPPEQFNGGGPGGGQDLQRGYHQGPPPQGGNYGPQDGNYGPPPGGGQGPHQGGYYGPPPQSGGPYDQHRGYDGGHPDDRSGYHQEPAYYDEEPDRKSDKGMIFALLAAIVLVTAGVLGVGWWQGWFNSGGKNASSPSASSSAQPGESSRSESNAPSTTNGGEGEDSSSSSSSSSESETSESESRPENPRIPADAKPANDAARDQKPSGDFNNVYTGSDLTSEAFAQSVRDAYVDNYLETDQLDATVKAYSSVTGQTYTMKCDDNGQFVTCTGGNNAIVYIS